MTQTTTASGLVIDELELGSGDTDLLRGLRD